MKLLMFIHMKRLSKEDNRVRWISNSCQLNKVMRHKQYLLPIFTDILRKCSRYKFFNKLDNSMQYYMFVLDNKSQDSRTIITPFGKHKYLRLLMRLKCSPEIAQAIMESVNNRWRIHMIDMNSYDMPMTWIYIIWCWCMWTHILLWSHT